MCIRDSPHRTIRRDSFKVMPLEQVGKLQTFSNHKNVEEKLTYKSSGTKPVDNIISIDWLFTESS